MNVEPQQIASAETACVEECEESVELLDAISDKTESRGTRCLPDEVVEQIESPKLKILLEERPGLFSFFQVMRLLRSGYFCNDEGQALKVRVTPSLTLSFQKGQVEQVIFPDGENGRDYVEVITSLPGLYGTGSPLPTFYTEDLIEQVADETRTVKDVYDILNQRLYDLLHSGRNKYRMMERTLEDQDGRFSDYLFGLVGLKEDQLKQLFPEPLRLIRYLGLFALKNRPASGLQAMLSDVIGNLPVKVIQAVEYTGRIPQDQRAVMGESLCLGETSTIGQEFRCSSGSITIEIGPVEEQDYYRFFPGTQEYECMVSLTRLYLSAPVKFDLEIILGSGTELNGTELGGSRGCCMGLDSWLGASGTSSRETERRVRFSPLLGNK